MKRALILAVLVLAVACGGANHPSMASTSRTEVPPSATSSPASAERCPVRQDLCDFARATEALLISGDVDSVVDAAPGRAVTCETGIDPGLGADFPLCKGATPGEVRFEVHFGRFQSEGGIVARGGLVALMSDWLRSIDAGQTDSDGNAAIRLMAMGCPIASQDVDCATGFNLVFTSIQRRTGREFLLITFLRDEPGLKRLAGADTGLLKLNVGYFTGSGTLPRLDPSDPKSPEIRYLPFGN